MQRSDDAYDAGPQRIRTIRAVGHRVPRPEHSGAIVTENGTLGGLPRLVRGKGI